MGKNKRIKAFKKAIKPVVDRMPVIMDQSYEWRFLSVEEYMEMFDLTKDKIAEVESMHSKEIKLGRSGIPIRYPLQIARNHSSRMVDAFKKGGTNAVNVYINKQVKIYQDYQAAKG